LPINYKRHTRTFKFVVVTVAPVQMLAGTHIPATQQMAVPA
jgi:hypothetical protein